jgi:hypothetical protein
MKPIIVLSCSMLPLTFTHEARFYVAAPREVEITLLIQPWTLHDLPYMLKSLHHHILLRSCTSKTELYNPSKARLQSQHRSCQPCDQDTPHEADVCTRVGPRSPPLGQKFVSRSCLELFIGNLGDSVPNYRRSNPMARRLGLVGAEFSSRCLHGSQP